MKDREGVPQWSGMTGAQKLQCLNGLYKRVQMLGDNGSALYEKADEDWQSALENIARCMAVDPLRRLLEKHAEWVMKHCSYLDSLRVQDHAGDIIHYKESI